MNEIEKYETDRIVYYTSIDGKIWYSEEIVDKLKKDNKYWKDMFDQRCFDCLTLLTEQHEMYKQLEQLKIIQEKLKQIKVIAKIGKGIKEMDEITKIINRRK